MLKFQEHECASKLPTHAQAQRGLGLASNRAAEAQHRGLMRLARGTNLIKTQTSTGALNGTTFVGSDEVNIEQELNAYESEVLSPSDSVEQGKHLLQYWKVCYIIFIFDVFVLITFPC